MSISGPKISVSLYGFTKELYTGYYTMEQCMEKAAESGADGVEIVNTQHIRRYPTPTPEYLDSFRKLMEKYRLEPACYGSYTDGALTKNGFVPDDVLVDALLRDLDFAEIMGFPVIRLGYDTSPKVLERVVDAAEKKEIKLGIELHAPITVEHPIYLKFEEMFDKLQSPYLGFVPDFSGWAKHLPDTVLNSAVSFGVPKAAAKMLGTAFVVGVDVEKIKKTAHSLGVPADFDYLLDLLFHVVVKGDPESLRKIMKRAVHVHGKFWGLDKNDMETCIPYPKLLSIVKESGYQGFVTSEYEGYELTPGYDGADNVRRHVGMMRKYLT